MVPEVPMEEEGPEGQEEAEEESPQVVCLVGGLHLYLGVTIHWTGLLDWTTTGLASNAIKCLFPLYYSF